MMDYNYMDHYQVHGGSCHQRVCVCACVYVCLCVCVCVCQCLFVVPIQLFTSVMFINHQYCVKCSRISLYSLSLERMFSISILRILLILFTVCFRYTCNWALIITGVLSLSFSSELFM